MGPMYSREWNWYCTTDVWSERDEDSLSWDDLMDTIGLRPKKQKKSLGFFPPQ